MIVLDAVLTGDYIHRREFLVTTIGEPLAIDQQPLEQCVGLTPSFLAADSASLYNHLREINRLWGCDFYEGVVMKRAGSIYPVQLRSATEEYRGWVKHRFVV